MFKAITSGMPNEAPVTQKELRDVIAAQLKLILELTAGFNSLVAVLEEKEMFSRADLKLALKAVQESTRYRQMHKTLLEVQDAESLENFLQGFEGTIQ
jgi:hypothetical protein